MAVSFNLPDPYEAQKQEIARRQKYAEALQQQAFEPVQPGSYQGIQAPVSTAAILAKALQGTLGGALAGESAREQRELRESDIAKGQQFAQALQEAKTPEDRQAIALRAMGGEFGQRAQTIGAGEYQMAETRGNKEAERAFRADEAEKNRIAAAERAREMADLRRELAAGPQSIAGMMAQARIDDMRRRADQLTGPEQRQLFQHLDAIDAGQSTINLLNQAKDLSGKFKGGVGAGTMAFVESQARSMAGMRPDQASNALIDYDNLVKEQALSQLKSTFGGNPTEGERKVLLELQASSQKTPEQRMEILNRAIALAEDRVRGATQRAESVRTRGYRAPGGQQEAPTAPTPGAGAAAPQQPAAPQAAGAAPTARQPQFTEGQTARNPTTGERVVFKSGKWEPLR